MTHLQEFPGVVVVHLEPLGLDVPPVALDSEPVEVLRDHVVGIGIDLLGVGVLEPEDEVPTISLHVLVVEDGDTGVSDVKGSRGPGCDTHDDLPVHSLEVGEFVLALLLLLHEHGGIHLRQCLGLCLQTHGVDLRHDLVDEGRDLPRLGPEFGASSEDLPHDGLGVGRTLEEHRVLQCEFPDRLLDLICHETGIPRVL